MGTKKRHAMTFDMGMGCRKCSTLLITLSVPAVLRGGILDPQSGLSSVQYGQLGAWAKYPESPITGSDVCLLIGGEHKHGKGDGGLLWGLEDFMPSRLQVG